MKLFYFISTILIFSNFISNSHASSIFPNIYSSLNLISSSKDTKSKPVKIKVAKIKKEKINEQEKLRESLEKTPSSPFKVNDMQFQIFTSVFYMVASKLLNKLDFKQKSILQFSRVFFCLYLILTQIVIKYIKNAIETNDDSSIVSISSPASSIPIPGMPSQPNKIQTVKEYDLGEISKMSSNTMFEVLSALYMHFVNKAGTPLLLVPIMGVLNKLRAPLIRIYILKEKSIGELSRPFKSSFDNILSNFAKTASLASTTASTDTTTTTTTTTVDTESSTVSSSGTESMVDQLLSSSTSSIATSSTQKDKDDEDEEDELDDGDSLDDKVELEDSKSLESTIENREEIEEVEVEVEEAVTSDDDNEEDSYDDGNEDQEDDNDNEDDNDENDNQDNEDGDDDEDK